jgi:hypothetical protein
MDPKNLKRKYNISIWEQHQLNYWAVTKCANTAIKVALSGYNINPSKINHKVKWVHNPDNVIYTDRETALSNGYRNFSVIRHPYDRFISLYKDQGLRRPLFKNLEDNSLDIFLNKILETQFDDNDSDPHVRSITSYLCDENKNILVDDVVKLNKAKSYLENKNLKLNVFNKTEEIKIELTDKQKEKIYNRYEADFIIFGFKK